MLFPALGHCRLVTVRQEGKRENLWKLAETGKNGQDPDDQISVMVDMKVFQCGTRKLLWSVISNTLLLGLVKSVGKAWVGED